MTNEKVISLFEEDEDIEQAIEFEKIEIEPEKAEPVKKQSNNISGPENKKSAKKEFFDWIKVILIAVAAAILINCFVIINSVVPSGSMESTIMTHSRMFGYRLAYLFSEPEQGDVIIFKYPVDEKQIFVKRVIGTPGDTVEIIGGVTYVNGEVLDEPYLNETPYDLDFGPYVVPEDSYFVMGDNRNHSNDARYWEKDGHAVSFVTREEILAKAVLCYWPLNRFGVIR